MASVQSYRWAAVAAGLIGAAGVGLAAAASHAGGEALLRRSRKPEIMADAAHAILCRGPDFTGNFLLDEQVLRDAGRTDFSPYAFDEGEELEIDLFVEGYCPPVS